MSVKNRIKQYVKHIGITIVAFEKSINVTNGYVNAISKSIGIEKISLIIEIYSNLNIEWLLTGNGEMLKENLKLYESQNIIPFYEDFYFFPISLKSDSINTIKSNSFKINSGDWFNGATAAIRHNGNSMIEYKNGCTLVIKECLEINEIIWGRNYVLETDEIKITCKVAYLDNENIICNFTNFESYPDGTLIFQPFKLNRLKIKNIYTILGSINKENGL